MKTLQEHIDEVMDHFDFNRVEKVMRLLDWKWGLGDDAEIPDIADMRKLVRSFMKRLHEHFINASEVHNECMGSGGFIIYYTKGIDNDGPFDSFNMAFQISDWYTGE